MKGIASLFGLMLVAYLLAALYVIATLFGIIVIGIAFGAFVVLLFVAGG